MTNPFSDHPHAVGETYLGHMGQASRIGFQMIGGGLACLVHAILPFAFVTTGSAVILGLAETCGQRRRLMAHATTDAAAQAARSAQG